MIIIDASAMVEALVGRDADPELLSAVAGELAAPHLVDIEVLSVLRGLVLGGKLDTSAADTARRDHFDLDIARHDTAPLAHRIWQLRHEYTTYDAAYLALAEALNAPLYTCDRKLATSGHQARVRLVPTTAA